MHGPEALERVGEADRQRRVHRRDVVAERAALGPSARTDTGTIALSSMPVGIAAAAARGARAARRLTTVSTTSLTVPPSAFLIALKRGEVRLHPREPPVRADRARSAGSAARRRARPTPSTPAQPASSPPRPRRPSARSPARARPRARRRAASTRARAARRRTASGRWAPGAGTRPGRARARAGSGSRSNSTVMMSTPEMPSTSAWCVLQTSAKWSSPTRSTSQISHSGLVRSSCCENTRPASLRSCSSPAGAGQRRVADVVARR